MRSHDAVTFEQARLRCLLIVDTPVFDRGREGLINGLEEYRNEHLGDALPVDLVIEAASPLTFQ